MNVLSAPRKYLRWLIWPGLALSTAGLMAGFIGTWDVLSIVLLALGLVLLLISLIFSGFGYRRFWQSRSTQAGTNAALATLSVLLILGVINFIAVQYGPRFDLTEGGLFTLSPETQSVVKNLEQPVKVVVFDAALSPNDQQLLESYQSFNNELTYEHINPFQEPTVAREFNVSGEGREVHLATDDRTVFVQALGAQGLNEQDLTNKLAQLGRDRSATVYFLQGHQEFVIDGSETGYAQAAEALRAENFTVEPINLAETATVPDNADAVVIAGPKQAFFEPEVAALETYLDQGGSLLVLVDPQTEPALDPLLEDWGISLDERLIIDTSNTGQIVGLGPAAPLVTTYGAHPITADFDNGRSFYPLARPILLEPVDGIEATPLLLSNAQSYAESLSETGELNVDTQNTPEGPFNIGIALTKETDIAAEAPEEDSTETDAPGTTTDIGAQLSAEAAEASSPEVPTNDTEARLIVIGNATFATDGLFDQQLNGDVFLNSVTWLSNLDDATLSIRPKEITNRRIVMTVSRQILVIVLALVGFPLVGIAGAGITWFRRR
ncbi:MAG: Gldg family protein [Cyanobacteria bacterium P01_H01_bin.26]